MNGEIATKNHPGKEQTDVTHDELLKNQMRSPEARAS
jgi:hypothetical protein